MPHNVFPMVTNPLWIPVRSIFNGNKYLTGNRFLKWKLFLFDLDIDFANMFPNQMETLLPFWILLRGIQNGLLTAFSGEEYFVCHVWVMT